MPEFLRIPRAGLFRPLVYRIVYGDVVVYIGMSRLGLERILQPQHVAARLMRQDGASIEVAFCSTPEEATRLESTEIHLHHPQLNKYCPTCKPKSPFPGTGRKPLDPARLLNVPVEDLTPQERRVLQRLLEDELSRTQVN